jgi:hypothetical protein
MELSNKITEEIVKLKPEEVIFPWKEDVFVLSD